LEVIQCEKQKETIQKQWNEEIMEHIG
jgi:hypothetical protein